MLGSLLVFWFTPGKGEEWVYILYPPLRRYNVGAVSRIQCRQCSLLHVTFSFSKHSSVSYACLRHPVISILPVLSRIQDIQREKMKSPEVLLFALATLSVMECYESGTKIYHQVIFKFMLWKEKRCYLAVTRGYFTCNKNNYDESKINLSLVLSFNFRATSFKTVQLSKRVSRESSGDRNIGYFCNIPTVSTPLAACPRPLIHWCFHNDCYKETHFRCQEITLSCCLGPLCRDLVIANSI